MANSKEKTLVLKLIGIASYNQPKFFNRIIYRGDIVPGIPASFAGSEDDPNSLLGMGSRSSEGDLVRPTWKDITAEFESQQRPARKTAAPADDEQDDDEQDEDEQDADDDAPDGADDAPADQEPAAPARAAKTSQRSTAARKTANKK